MLTLREKTLEPAERYEPIGASRDCRIRSGPRQRSGVSLCVQARELVHGVLRLIPMRAAFVAAMLTAALGVACGDADEVSSVDQVVESAADSTAPPPTSASQDPPPPPATVGRLDVTVRSPEGDSGTTLLGVVQKNVGEEVGLYDGHMWALERWSGTAWELVALLPWDSNVDRVDAACPLSDSAEGPEVDCAVANAEAPTVSPGEVGGLREFTLFPVEPGSYRVRGWRRDGELMSESPLSPVFELPQPADASSVVPVGFSLVESFDEIEPAYWLPVMVDGEPVVFESGAHWRLSGSGDAVSVSGYAACNKFQSVGDGLNRYENGTVVELHMEFEMQGCGGDVAVVPEVGDRFFVSGDGTTLVVENDAAVRVRLELRDAEPIGSRMTQEEQATGQAQQDAEEQRQRDEREAEMQATRAAVIAELAAARERWATAGPQNYELRFQSACLVCPSFPRDPTESDRIETIDVVGGVASGPWTEASIGATVDDWLSYLDNHLAAGGYATAQFDADLGYPVDVYVAMAGAVRTDAGAGSDEFVLQAVVVAPK